MRILRLFCLLAFLAHLSSADYRAAVNAAEKYRAADFDTATADASISLPAFGAVHDSLHSTSSTQQTRAAVADTLSFGERALSIARAQLGRGPLRVGAELNRYPFDLGRYLRPNEAWCSEFVSWVYLTAGMPLTGGRGGWMIKNSKGLRHWFQTNAFFVSREDPFWDLAAPSPGDYIRYNNDKGGHSGLVYAVKGPMMRTIEGNVSNRVVIKTLRNWRDRLDIDGIGLRNRTVIEKYARFLSVDKQPQSL